MGRTIDCKKWLDKIMVLDTNSQDKSKLIEDLNKIVKNAGRANMYEIFYNVILYQLKITLDKYRIDKDYKINFDDEERDKSEMNNLFKLLHIFGIYTSLDNSIDEPYSKLRKIMDEEMVGFSPSGTDDGKTYSIFDLLILDIGPENLSNLVFATFGFSDVQKEKVLSVISHQTLDDRTKAVCRAIVEHSLYIDQDLNFFYVDREKHELYQVKIPEDIMGFCLIKKGFDSDMKDFFECLFENFSEEDLRMPDMQKALISIKFDIILNEGRFSRFDRESGEFKEIPLSDAVSLYCDNDRDSFERLFPEFIGTYEYPVAVVAQKTDNFSEPQLPNHHTQDVPALQEQTLHVPSLVSGDEITKMHMVKPKPLIISTNKGRIHYIYKPKFVKGKFAGCVKERIWQEPKDTKKIVLEPMNPPPESSNSPSENSLLGRHPQIRPSSQQGRGF